VVLGYPRLFPTELEGDCGNGIHNEWVGWLNDAETQLNGALAEAVHAVRQAEFVDTSSAFAGHEACGRVDGADEYVNDLQLHCPGGNGSVEFAVCAESYHPTPHGYLVLRDLLFDQLDNQAGSDLPPVTKAPPASCPKNNQCAAPNTSLSDSSGRQINASALEHVTQAVGRTLCASITFHNRSSQTQTLSDAGWLIQRAGAADRVGEPTLSGYSSLSLNLAPGTTGNGRICFYDPRWQGPILLTYQPARLVWINSP
jgi:hypothetical protein